LLNGTSSPPSSSSQSTEATSIQTTSGTLAAGYIVVIVLGALILIGVLVIGAVLLMIYRRKESRRRMSFVEDAAEVPMPAISTSKVPRPVPPISTDSPRSMAAPPRRQKLQVGSECLAKAEDGAFYKATIEDRKHNEYLIKFVDQDTEPQWLPASSVKSNF
jgi:hypothetical protein